ncbi:type I-C CRISPR-associated protein Cas8c/Csd1 [Ventosimonas gracilis]|uniref:Type I-C CRISPR-associated protein Cas8c/Csd1 n=1 Tax=Ventosimonas gracilis TaxID=1680762 RepID=A0A139SJ54_9GAMM|nr:type I-C CRISPR-associated protein Cas8c/Csd1 [Ventosimonas gracilis]KXU34579.1 type I-C CRISPR-associated protein Cas8c/Csd1 [Ventosimonas gracilis]
MILSALNSYYQRLLLDSDSGISPPGYSQEKISYAIVLGSDGAVVDVMDIRDTSGKKPTPKSLSVPASFKRTVGVKSFFLWDKTSYALGVSANSKRCEQEHAAFRLLHEQSLAGTEDPGLKALLAFLETWTPEQFQKHPAFVPHREAMLDANIVFRFDDFADKHQYLHQRPAADQAWSKLFDGDAEDRQGICLVTGERAPLARLHPSIKGVRGAQSSGASIVSFNLESFTSYGKEQGENAPISEQAAFAYTTALNHLLRRESRQQIQIGDATVVFWAQATDADQAENAESLLSLFFDPRDEDPREIQKLRDALDQVRQGLPLQALDPGLNDGTHIFVLGISPNAARLSIRFWETQTLATFAARLARHFDDLRLEPSPWRAPPAIWRLLLACAPSRDGRSKNEDVPPFLAGETTRAILAGTPYPRSLLGTILMRLRADGHISGTRVALCKAILARDARLGNINKEPPPVSLDSTNTNPGYLLGRLFSTLERVQGDALGPQINATIRDRYYGAASATPAIVFPLLLRNAQNHLSRVRKDNPGRAVNLEKEIGEIIDALGTTFPRSLRMEAQGHFAIGYYHQKTKPRSARPDTQTTTDNDSAGENE